MAFTYNPATDLGKVRLLIMDTVDLGHTFEDDELQALLDLEDQSIRYAAADALVSLSANKSRLAQKIKVLDIDVDTRDAAKSLLDLAEKLRDQEDNSGSFEIAELVTNHFTERERIYKQWQRRNFT